MVSVLVSSVFDRGFKPRLDQTKDNKIEIVTQLYIEEEQDSTMAKRASNKMQSTT
jgi:hypothetical protein